MKVWLDIDNPPQVQYLCPFWSYLHEDLREEVILTARDVGSTVALIRQRGIEPQVFGTATGASRVRKLTATSLRAGRLLLHLRSAGKPDVLISSSRSSALTARLLGLPAFIFCDYEFAELESYRKLGATILFPEVIGYRHFEDLGFPRERLLAFRGLKEDISFRGVELDAVPSLSINRDAQLVRVLLRPPAATSHYYTSASGSLYQDVLRDLARRAGTVTLFSPRQQSQIAELESLSWVHEPVILDNRANFVSLLKAVDVVVSSGGTMLREAAYLGVPAISILRGSRGAVDRYLESHGFLTFASTAEEFAAIELRKRTGAASLRKTPDVVEQIIHEIKATL